MDLVHMHHEEGEGAPTVAAFGGSDYPYGLTLRLEAQDLEKLGIDPEELPTAGKEFHLEAAGVIKRSSTEDPDADGDIDCVCLELQITHMGLEHEAEEHERDHAKSLYGGKEKEEG